MILPGIQYLLSSQNNDGGWGYFPNQTSSVEPTSCVVLVIKEQEKLRDFHSQAIEWLINAQNNDGGWGINRLDNKSGWQTAWALISLAGSSANPEFIKSATDWLLNFGLKSLEENETLDTIRKHFNIDTNLYGWPWQSGEAAWIEPTALSLLALNSVEMDPQHHERIQEAILYLDDRRCRDGGWNFGNPVMFNKDLPPRTYHTSLSILALSRISPNIILGEDISTLNKLLDDEGRPLGIALGILALKALNQDTSLLENKLLALQKSDGSWEGNIYFSAMSLLALTPDMKIFT